MKNSETLIGRVLLVLIPVLAVAAPKPALEPFSLKQDFQENSLGQWASYPPVQDVGYDPSLSPAFEFGAPGGRSLMRIVRPVTPGPFRLGFIRRLGAASGDAVRMSFSYRLKPG